MALGERVHVFAQEAVSFVMPAWAVIMGWLTSVGVATTIIWNFVSGHIDQKIDARVDDIVDGEIDKVMTAIEQRFEKLEARFREYETRQSTIAEDVAYIRGAIESGLHS